MDVVLAQPLPGVPGVRLRRLRRPVHLQLTGSLGPGVSTGLPVVGAQGNRPLLLLPGLRELRVRWVGGGCRGSSRFRGRRCGICERSVVVD